MRRDLSMMYAHKFKEPVIAVIIPVHNRRELPLKCLKQLREVNKNGFRFDVIVIDDGSTEAVSALYPEVIILCGDGNLGWTGAINKERVGWPD